MNNLKFGCLLSPIDERDYKMEVTAATDVPKSFVLDYHFSILNQGNVSSCVAFALSEMKSYIDGNNISNMYSQGFIYANREEEQFQGEGMITREALANIVKYGDCFNSEFPINEEYPNILGKFEKYNKNKLMKSALEHKSLAYVSLNNNQIKSYLYNQKKPVMICVKCYSNFSDSLKNKGIIPSVPQGEYSGNHAMVCIGFRGDQLILVNSWGNNKGDNGIFYLDVNNQIIREIWALEDKKIIKNNDVVEPSPSDNKNKILYRLQLGAFKSYSNALNFAQKLNGENIATCIKKYPDFYKIQVGAFLNKDNCINYQKQLKLKGYNCFIVEEI